VRRRCRQLTAALVLAGFIVLLGHPLASAASDLWGNVAPPSPLGSGGLFGRYPVDHYTLDQHFDAVSVSLTGGVDVSGVPPMIAYFLAGSLWALTSFLANALISLFAFAFSLDLVNGSQQTGGVGALAPVSQAIHSIYSNVFGGPWLVLAISVAGIWAMWRALVQRRYAETAGALALSLIYIVIALFFVAEPGTTIGAASKLTNQMSEAFLAISDHGSPGGAQQAKDDDADQLFELLVYRPWTVLEFGGLEHCVLSGTGSEDSDPVSAPVRPLSTNPARDAALARRLASGEEVTADGKVCVNNANKYASHFLRFGLETDERGAEYDALDHGDSSKLPEADTESAGYKLGVADKPATDQMEAGGQYQRLLIAIVVFFGELGAMALLGSLSVGVILAQVLLLFLLAFSPVALVAAAIPGRGHNFFKSWLEKLAGYLLRKAAYSLILAILLAVDGALASATSQLGWLMSFGLQGLFFWATFLQRKTLADSLIGIATGPSAPGRDGALRLLSIYAGARITGKALRPARRGARSAASLPGRLFGGSQGGGSKSSPDRSAPRLGTSHTQPVGPSTDASTAAERPRSTDGSTAPGRSTPSPRAQERQVKGAPEGDAQATGKKKAGEAKHSVTKGGKRRAKATASDPSAERPARAEGTANTEPNGTRQRKSAAGTSAPVPARRSPEKEGDLGAELRAERERPAQPRSEGPQGQADKPAPPRRRWRKGPRK
jgi:hypothetical protein